MTTRNTRARLALETLEDRWAPATLALTPRGTRWIDPEPQPIVQEVAAAAQPGPATAQVHTGGVMQWAPE